MLKLIMNETLTNNIKKVEVKINDFDELVLGFYKEEGYYDIYHLLNSTDKDKFEEIKINIQNKINELINNNVETTIEEFHEELNQYLFNSEHFEVD